MVCPVAQVMKQILYFSLKSVFVCLFFSLKLFCKHDFSLIVSPVPLSVFSSISSFLLSLLVVESKPGRAETLKSSNKESKIPAKSTGHRSLPEYLKGRKKWPMF